jgi:hypothetical protein
LRVERLVDGVIRRVFFSHDLTASRVLTV